MTEAQELGRTGENIAADYVLSLGWKILARNVRNQYGELDITAIDDNDLVIIEVRARTLGQIQSPITTIGPRKLRTLVRASMEFVSCLEWDGFWRIDVIGITFHDNTWELEHIRDITAGMNISS